MSSSRSRICAADRHVERRRRLVGDDDARIERDRAGDADALALAAGEGVRIALHRQPGRGRPAPSARRRVSSSRAARDAGDEQRLADDLLHRHARIERGERILEDQPHSRWHALKLALSSVATSTLLAVAVGRVTVPAVGSTIAQDQRPSVVLPEPLSPTMPRFSPGMRSKLTSSTALHGTASCRRTSHR